MADSPAYSHVEQFGTQNLGTGYSFQMRVFASRSLAEDEKDQLGELLDSVLDAVTDVAAFMDAVATNPLVEPSGCDLGDCSEARNS